MRKFLVTLVLGMLCSVHVSAQSDEDISSVEEHFDLLTSEWLRLSGDLKTYDGLSFFCRDESFRQHTFNVLSQIHHYDSLILLLFEDPEVVAEMSKKEYRHSKKDIETFEKEYSIKNFVGHLKESCGDRNEIERNKDDLQKQSGMYSYDGQVLLIETEIRKYLKHIDKVVIAIDDHVHMLQLDDVKAFKLLAEKGIGQ